METVKLALLRAAMGAYNYRHQAISANLANLETPGYNRIEVSFEDQLQQMRGQLATKDDVQGLNANVRQTEERPILEEEMLSLAENNMRIQFASRALREHFDLIRTGITGRTA